MRERRRWNDEVKWHIVLIRFLRDTSNKQLRTGKGKRHMLNNVNRKRELDRVSMLIRALSEEMTQDRTHSVGNASRNAIPTQMKEALYELRLRKLLISALVCSDRTSDTISH